MLQYSSSSYVHARVRIAIYIAIYTCVHVYNSTRVLLVTRVSIILKYACTYYYLLGFASCEADRCPHACYYPGIRYLQSMHGCHDRGDDTGIPVPVLYVHACTYSSSMLPE